MKLFLFITVAFLVLSAARVRASSSQSSSYESDALDKEITTPSLEENNITKDIVKYVEPINCTTFHDNNQLIPTVVFSPPPPTSNTEDPSFVNIVFNVDPRILASFGNLPRTSLPYFQKSYIFLEAPPLPQNLLIHAPNNTKPLPQKDDKVPKNRLGQFIRKLKEVHSRCKRTLGELEEASLKLMNFLIKDAINIHIDTAFENVYSQAEILNTSYSNYDKVTKIFKSLIYLLEELLSQHEQKFKEAIKRAERLAESSMEQFEHAENQFLANLKETEEFYRNIQGNEFQITDFQEDFPLNVFQIEEN